MNWLGRLCLVLLLLGTTTAEFTDISPIVNGSALSGSACGTEFSASEVAELTRPNRKSESGEDADRVERAYTQKYCGADPANVSLTLGETANQLDSLYAGLSYDRDTMTFTIWTVLGQAVSETATATLRDAFARANPGGAFKLNIAEASYTEGQLRAAAHDLASPVTWPTSLRARVSRSVGALVDVRNQQVVLTVTGDLAEIQSYVDQRYPGMVTVQPGQLVPEVENRRLDSPSNGYNGGLPLCIYPTGQDCNEDPTASQELAECTGGFKWFRNSVAWMVTAGHCIENLPSADWRRYAMGGATRYTVGFSSTAITSNNVDAALIRQDTYSYRNWFWIGGMYGTDEREITDYANYPSVGADVQVSGGNSGFLSGGTVTDTAYSFTVNGHSYIGAFVDDLDTQPGDSGSPYVGWNTGTAQSGDYLVYGSHSTHLFSGGVSVGTVFTRVADITLQLGGYPAH